MCNEGVLCGFGVAPFNNHHHSFLDMSKKHGGHVGNYTDESLLFVMPFHVALKHDVLTEKKNNPSCCGFSLRTPQESAMVSRPPMIDARQMYGLFFLQSSVTYCAFYRGRGSECVTRKVSG